MDTTKKAPAKRKATRIVKKNNSPNNIKVDVSGISEVKNFSAKTYKLTKNQPLSFLLNVGRNKKLLVWDEETNSSRAIRHCPNERTIWLDEQSNENAVVEPIVFTKGFIHTSERNLYTQKFLEVHPKNGVLFELVNAEADARSVVSHEDIVLDVKQAIREKVKEEGGVEALRAVVAVLTSDAGGAAVMTPSELRFAAYEAVDTNVHRFIDDNKRITIFDDADIKRTAIAQHAFLSGVIQVSPNGRQIIWYDTKTPICNIPMGLNYLEVFSEFLSTEAGMQVAVELTKR